MQMGFQFQKTKNKKVKELLKALQKIEDNLKIDPNMDNKNKLTETRQALRTTLLHDYEKELLSIRASYYTAYNKPSKLMANRVKSRKIKAAIPFLFTSQDKQNRETHPMKIANLFSEYYSSLYNLKEDNETPRPSQEAIDSLKQEARSISQN